MARELAKNAKAGDRIILEGPMGAGKSTFARAFLSARGVEGGGQGSPTYVLAHEYATRKGPVLHMDFYRLEDRAAVSATGLDAALRERADAVILTEWISKFDDLMNATEAQPGWSVRVAFSTKATHRQVEIQKRGASSK